MTITYEQAQKVFEQADCLYSGAEVDKAISLIADKINEKLQGKTPLVLCVMNGGIVLAGQILPRLNMILNLDYIHVTRYGGNATGGELQWLVTPRSSIKGRDVLVIDDILDEGETLKAIINDCMQAGASAVHSAVLANKLHDHKSDVKVDFIGLDVPDRFVFGYGMDYKGFLRNAPGIYAEKED